MNKLDVRSLALHYCIESYKDHFRLVDLDGIEFMTFEHENLPAHCFLVFRGSDEWGDWLTNFKAYPAKKTPKGKFHRGYVKKMLKHWQKIQNQLPKGKKIIVAGHSKGGAEAQLFALLSNRSIEQVVTFGAPKPIKKLFHQTYIDRMRKITTNYVNPHDAVTKAPFWWDRLGKDVIRKIKKKGSEHPLSVYAEFFNEL